MEGMRNRHSCYTWIGVDTRDAESSPRLSGLTGQSAVTERRIQRHQSNLPEEEEEHGQTAEDQGESRPTADFELTSRPNRRQTSSRSFNCAVRRNRGRRSINSSHGYIGPTNCTDWNRSRRRCGRRRCSSSSTAGQ